jgi:hypothetical protein
LRDTGVPKYILGLVVSKVLGPSSFSEKTITVAPHLQGVHEFAFRGFDDSFSRKVL